MSTLGIETSSGRFDMNNTINAASKLGQGSLQGPERGHSLSLGLPQAYKSCTQRGPCPLSSEPGVVSVPTDPPLLPPQLQTELLVRHFSPCALLLLSPKQGGYTFQQERCRLDRGRTSWLTAGWCEIPERAARETLFFRAFKTWQALSPFGTQGATAP